MASTVELLERVEARPTTDAGRRHRYLLPGLVIALAVVPKLFFLKVPILGMDESILLIYPEQLLDGRVPNRDFFTVYGPGNFAVLAAAFSVFGQSLVVERLVGVAYQAAIVAGVMGVTRRHGFGAHIGAGVVSVLLMAGPTPALSWMGGLAISVCSLALLHRGGHRAAMVAGVLAGLAMCWRYEMAVLVVAAAPLLWRDARARRYLVGYAVGLVPTVLHMGVAGRAVVDNVVLERMGLNAQLDSSLLSPFVALLAGLLLLAGVGMLAMALWRRDRVALSSAVLAVLLLPQAFQRVDFVHVVAMAGSVVFPLALGPLFGLMRRSAPPGVVEAVAGFAVLAFAVEAALTPGTNVVHHGGRTLYGSPAARQVVAAVTEHVPAGSRVFIGSSDMSVPTVTAIELYQLLPEYRNDFYYLELPVGVAEKHGSPLVADIESADALVLTDPPPGLELQYPHLGTGSQDANRAVAAGFCPVEELAVAVIYVAC